MRILFLAFVALAFSAVGFSQSVCSASAPITITASGNTQIVGLSSGSITLCHISLSSSAATDITLTYGAGTNCGTGTGSLSGAYKAVSTLALGFGPNSGPRVPAGNAFCISSSVTATVGGLVTYTIY